MADRPSRPNPCSCARWLRLVCVLWVAASWPTAAAAQVGARPPDPGAPEQSTQPAQGCEGCLEKHPYLAVAEVLGVNLVYAGLNQVLPWEDEADHYHVSPGSWARNLSHGFAFDNDPFIINQFGHPYQGGNYFNAGRAQGLTYWESMPLATLGSVTWEWFGETEVPTWNDVINTTLGGALFGEVLYRLGWLVRGTSGPWAGSRWRAAAAAAIDPVTGLNRLIAPDASNADARPGHLHPARVGGEVQLGVQAGRAGSSLRSAEGIPYGAFAIDYGRLESGPAAAPFDAFTMTMRVGGGTAITDLSVRGRLASRVLGSTDGHALVLAQGYDYLANRELHFGSQSFLGGRADVFGRSDGWSVSTRLLAGIAALGAIELPNRGETRQLDYGSGLVASGFASLALSGRPLGRLSCEWTYLRTLTRSPADHLLTVLRAEARVPLWRRLGVGIEGEHIVRDSHGERFEGRARRYSQARAFLAWEFGR